MFKKYLNIVSFLKKENITLIFKNIIYFLVENIL